MIWNVYKYNINSRQLEQFNIFNHHGFSKDFEELKSKRFDEEQFAERLNRIVMYYFRCKYEYEVLVGEYSDRENRVEMRVDIYDQIKLNWGAFVDYCLGRASPCQIGDKLWFVSGDDDPVEATISMMTQKADRTWKIRISYNHSRIPTHISLREITETDIGKTIFYTKEDAEREAQRRARR